MSSGFVGAICCVGGSSWLCVHCDCRKLPNNQTNLYVCFGSLGLAFELHGWVLCHVFVGVGCCVSVFAVVCGGAGLG